MKKSSFEYLVPLTLTVSALVGCHNKSENKNLNILVIMSDQHRFDCIGVNGNADVKTPNIDMLASDGVVYQNCFCALPVSTPSRYSFLSGLYVNEHNGWTNRSTLKPEIRTFPDVLKESGYKTKAVGKMHFTPTYLDAGFEKMVLAEQDGPGRWDDDYHRDLKKNGLVDINDLEDQRKEYREKASEEYWASFGAMESNLPDKFSSTSWIGDQAIRTVEDWGTGGNLLMVSFIKPHHPFDPSDKWINMYEPEKLTLLPGWIKESIPYDLKENPGYFPNKDLTEASLRKSMAYYYAAISKIDLEVGRLINLLKEKGIYDNTLIIYTADHGEHMGYHHQILKAGFLYESIMKVPLIIKYPASKNKGRRSSYLASNVDIAPTILKQAGLKVPAEMSGYDLASESISRDIVFAHNVTGKSVMARSSSRKLIYCPSGRSLYFDLEKDPLEMKNLFGYPEYQAEINAFVEWIVKFQGQKQITGENFLDQNAPKINQPNVPPSNDGHIEKIIEYYKNKMKK